MLLMQTGNIASERYFEIILLECVGSSLWQREERNRSGRENIQTHVKRERQKREVQIHWVKEGN
jgi:hypothetical protein